MTATNHDHDGHNMAVWFVATIDVADMEQFT